MLRAALPRYHGLGDEQVLAQRFLLADAQLLLARKAGYETRATLTSGVAHMTQTTPRSDASGPDAVHTAIRRRLESALDQPTEAWLQPDTGRTAAACYSVTLADGSHVFIKAATDEQTEAWLRTEYLALQHVPERLVPRVIAWLDEPGSHPILVVEDLHQAHWPASHEGVNWHDGDIERVLAAVSELSAFPAPNGFASAEPWPASWPALVRTGPARDAFLNLGLCTTGWLAEAAPTLIAAEASLEDRGDRLVHGDLRSDNICIDGERVVFVDWSQATRGHAEHDLAALLPTLHLEGGPPPYDVLPDGGRWAAAGCAALIGRVLNDTSLPQWLTRVIVRIAAIDLSWAASCLGLPQPDGTSWHAL